MSTKRNYLLPNEIVEAYKAASAKGETIFRVDWNNAKDYEGTATTTYIPFEMHIGGKWVPVNIKCVRAVNEAHVKDVLKRKDLPPTITFKRSSTCIIKDGKVEKEHSLGEALYIVSTEYERVCADDIKAGNTGEVEIKRKDVPPKSKLQTQFEIKDPSGIKKKTKSYQKLEDPLIRIDMKVIKKDRKDRTGKILKAGTFETRVYDQSKPLPKSDCKFKLASVEGKPLCNDNIHKFMFAGSQITTVLNMSQVCPSDKGTTLLCKTSYEMYVIPGIPGQSSSVTEDDIRVSSRAPDVEEADADVAAAVVDDVTTEDPGFDGIV